MIDVHDTGNGFAFVTYNHKKVSNGLELFSITRSRNHLGKKVLAYDQEAKKAIREMNGATIAGQEIKVRKEDSLKS